MRDALTLLLAAGCAFAVSGRYPDGGTAFLWACGGLASLCAAMFFVWAATEGLTRTGTPVGRVAQSVWILTVVSQSCIFPAEVWDAWDAMLYRGFAVLAPLVLFAALADEIRGES